MVPVSELSARAQLNGSSALGLPLRVRHSSARIAQRSWSRQRPPIFRLRGEKPSRLKPAPRARAIEVDDADRAMLSIASGEWDQAQVAAWLRDHLLPPTDP
jgi:hypothetical protein